MNLLELEELIRQGESATVELKRDDIDGGKLARELAALCNHHGGYLLLGVDDDGSVIGLQRSRAQAEERVMNICQDGLQPPLLPSWEVIPWGEREVGVIRIHEQDAPDKPYKARSGKGGDWVTFVRVGSTCRKATREQESRLYHRAGLLREELKPVRRATRADLDPERIRHYFESLRGQAFPDDVTRLLIHTEFLVDYGTASVPSVAGMLLFGTNPRRYLPQSGVSVAAYPGTEKDYAAIERAVLKGPLVPAPDSFEAWSPQGGDAEEAGIPDDPLRRDDASPTGLIDQVMAFVLRHNPPVATLEGARRVDSHARWPMDAVREAVVNALIHRDYGIAGTDVELNLYSDRLEVVSPGLLPNSITVERMSAGTRYSRNTLLTDVMRDYGYVGNTGPGVPRKILRGMRAFNGTEPIFREENGRFTVTLLTLATPASP